MRSLETSEETDLHTKKKILILFTNQKEIDTSSKKKDSI